MSGNMPALVHKQYNSPVNLYSEKNIAETLEAHTEVLTSGAKGFVQCLLFNWFDSFQMISITSKQKKIE